MVCDGQIGAGGAHAPPLLGARTAIVVAQYATYTTATPAVHTRVLGRNTLAKMLNAVYPSIGPHRNTTNTISGMYLLR